MSKLVSGYACHYKKHCAIVYRSINLCEVILFELSSGMSKSLVIFHPCLNVTLAYHLSVFTSNLPQPVSALLPGL